MSLPKERHAMIKILVTAPRGHMAGLIIREAVSTDGIMVTGAVGPCGREYIGMDTGDICGIGPIGIPVSDDIEKTIDDCDVVVDYSQVEFSMKVLASCVKHRKPLVCGTTGFDDSQCAEFEKAAHEIPVMKAANTSFMVQLMQNLLADAAAALSGKCKIEIIDMHDENKLDAPSGTAIEMAETMAAASGRPKNEITFHSVRAGTIPSSHTVIFGAKGERMEITHHAYDWECYAKGACDAVRFIAGRPIGFYTMADVVG